MQKSDSLRVLKHFEADFNIRNKDGLNAFEIMVEKDDIKLFEEYFDSFKASLKIPWGEQDLTAMHVAACTGAIKCLKFMLHKHKMDPNMVNNPKLK